MNRATKWYDSPLLSWIAAAIALGMTLLYIQRLVEPDHPPTTGFVTGAWVLMLVVWLVSAIYKTWFRR